MLNAGLDQVRQRNTSMAGALWRRLKHFLCQYCPQVPSKWFTSQWNRGVKQSFCN